MLTTKIITLLTISALAGSCANTHCTETAGHSCPEPGHGPCYLCDTPEKDGSTNYELSEVR